MLKCTSRINKILTEESTLNKENNKSFRRPKKRWQPDEVASLKKLVGSGLPFTLMVINNRTPRAMFMKAKSLGLTTQTRWTEKEIFAIAKAAQSGQSPAVALKKIGESGLDRSRTAVRAKMIRLGLKAKRPPRQEWTSNEKEVLKGLFGRGYSARDIKANSLFGPDRVASDGTMLSERSVNALLKMAGRLGLTDPATRRDLGASHRRLPKELSKRLNDFILAAGDAVPSREIAACFGVHSSTVRRRRKRLRNTIP